MQLNELAKRLKMTSKELVQELKRRRITVKALTDEIDPKTVEAVKKKSERPTARTRTKPVKRAAKKVAPHRVRKAATLEKAAARTSVVPISPLPSGERVRVRGESKDSPSHPRLRRGPPSAADLFPQGGEGTAEKKAELRSRKKTTFEPKGPPTEEITAVEKPAVLAKPAPVETRPLVKKEASESARQPVAPSPAPPVMAAQVKVPSEPVRVRPIRIEMPITVGNLAQKLGVTVPSLIKTLMGLGVFANVNQLLNEEIIWKASKAIGIEIEKEADDVTQSILVTSEEDPKDLRLRPPVVTLMGHVDHGKTSLLDAIRRSDVAARETGQITQHIGAYNVHIENKGLVTFLDTPGHEAFTAMRARGANVTDVVVLVVAADDGVMPQTIEAMDHARAASVPIVVAINKVDLPTADPNRVMGELQKHGLVPEEWGGKTVCVKVSARTRVGVDELLELLLLEAELLELKANPNRAAQGTVLEAKLTKSQGPVSTLLVQNGRLSVGDIVVVGPYYGKVRAMRNDRGKQVKEAAPSYAVEVLGISGAPEAGELFTVVQDEQVARRIAERKSLELRERALKGLHTKHLSLEDLYSRVKEGRIRELKLIIKADVQGSVEALTQSLGQISTEKIQLRVIHGGVGGISESDIMLAVASEAIVIGFHVKPDDRAQALIEKEGVDVRFYNLIYAAIEDIQKAMEGLLEPASREVIEGRCEIRQIFHSSKVGTIGGGVVKKGRLVRNYPVRVLRDNIVIHQGRLGSLKRFKEDVREVGEGYDCGLVVEGFGELKESDVIESYRIEKVAAKLA